MALPSFHSCRRARSPPSASGGAPAAATSAPAAAPTQAAAAPTTRARRGTDDGPRAGRGRDHRARRQRRRFPPTARPPISRCSSPRTTAPSDFTTLDFFESVYKRARLQVRPADRAAGAPQQELRNPPRRRHEVERSTRPGLVWTFNLDPNLMWSDDTPLTADDYVATFQYGADPKHAWDFTWFYTGVLKTGTTSSPAQGPEPSSASRRSTRTPCSSTTQNPAPYLPAMLLYSMALQKKALEAHGGLYNSDPATSVSAGPFVLKSVEQGRSADPATPTRSTRARTSPHPAGDQLRRRAQRDLRGLSGRRGRHRARQLPVAGRQRHHRRRPAALQRSRIRTTATSVPTTCSSTVRIRPSTT